MSRKKYSDLEFQNGLFFSVLIALLFCSVTDISAYNWPWDQGHDCVIGDDGTYGKYDGVHDNKQDAWHGGFTTKECCIEYCQICPVYANTGEYKQSYTDLTLPGVGPSLRIVRTYSSLDWSNTLFGRSWIFNLGRQLIIAQDENGEKILIVRLETGERNYFKELSDGTIERITDYGVSYTLIKNTDSTYTIFNQDGSKNELNVDGKTTHIIDKNNNSLTFEYNVVGCLQRITNASGNYIDITLGANGKIASISDNLGRVISYTYDDKGNLTSFSDPMGNTSHYVYNSRNLLTQIIDPRGNAITTIGYEGGDSARVATFTEKGETYSIAYFDGRTEKTDSQGNKWTYYYNDVGVIERTINPLGYEKKHQLNKVTSTSVDWEEDLNGNRTTYTYDGDGNMTSKTDPLGNTTTYTYVIETDLVESETNPLGVVTRYEYDVNGNQTKIIRNDDGSLENTTTYTYDIKGNQTSVTDPLGHTNAYEYNVNENIIKMTDPLGNVTTYTYDNRGNRLTETDANGNTTTYAYDNLLDRLVSVTDALGNTTTYAYDANGNKLTETDANGNTRTYVYDAYNRLVRNTTSYSYDSRDNLISKTDANDKTTTYTFDILNRLIRKTDALGGQTSYTYDAYGNILTVTDPGGNITSYLYDFVNRKTSETNPLGEITSYVYNARGQVIQVTYPNGNVVTRTYNTLGYAVSVSDSIGSIFSYVYDDIGRIIQKTDAQGSATNFSYNAIGRLIRVTDAMGNSTQYTYDALGNILFTTGREGNVTSMTYDALRRVITQTDPSGNTTQLAFDNVGNMVQTTNPRGNTTCFEYDSLHRRIKKTYADGTFMEWSYDNARNLVSQRNENGQITQYTYDALNRKLKEEWPASGKSNDFSYDVVGNLISASNTSSSVCFGYDGIKRLVSTTQDGHEIIYQHNTINGITTITYPNAKQIHEIRDARSVLTRVEEPGSFFYVVYSHDNMGRQLAVNYPDELTIGYIRDSLGRITDVTHSNGANQLAVFRYTRDKEGHKLARLDVITPDKSEEYRYDASYRITDRKVGPLEGGVVNSTTSSEVFEYDSAGNIVRYIYDGVVENRTYNNLNQIVSIDGTTVTYDSCGNLIDDGYKTYAYDEENQLVQVARKSDGQILAEFEYDALKRRVRKKTYIPNVEETHFIYDGFSFRALAEATSNGTIDRVYVWGADLSGAKDGGGGVGGLLAVEDIGLGSLIGHGYDDIGNVITLYDLNTSNDIVGQFRYSAFGNTIESAGAEAQSTPYRFSTKYLDLETDFLYYGRRYYDSSKQRWINRDPLYNSIVEPNMSLAQEFNIYTFAKNNGVNWYDYNGLYTLGDAKNSFCSSLCISWPSILRPLCEDRCIPTPTVLFNEWMRLERSRGSWWTVLPKCPRTICLKNGNPLNPDPSVWETPDHANSLHRPAIWEIRTRPREDLHGNQCTYNVDGVIMTTIPAGGTADWISPNPLTNVWGHFNHDVLPYKLADLLSKRVNYYTVRPVW